MRLLCWLGVLFAPLSLTAATPWTLPAAVNHALTNNPDAILATHRIAVAQAMIEQAEARFWPRIQFQSSYVWTDNPVTVFGAALNQSEFEFGGFDLNDPPTSDNLNARGLLTMPLYTGGGLTGAKEAAMASSLAEGQNARVVQDTLAFMVARAYHTVHKARELIQSTEATVQSFEKNLRLAKVRQEAGTILKTEALDVEVQLARAREDLIRARNTGVLAVRTLKNLLGIETGEFLVSDEVPDLSAPDSTDVSRRPEIEEARERIRAARAELRRTQGGRRPRISAFASYDLDAGSEFGGVGNSWTAGAVFRWDIWDGRLNRARVREARGRVRLAEERERKIRLAIDLQFTRAKLDLNTARERLTSTDAAVGQAGESVELTRARFKQGRALSTQLIDAETAFTTARVRRAEAEADLRIAVAALRRALGMPRLPGKLRCRRRGAADVGPKTAGLNQEEFDYGGH